MESPLKKYQYQLSKASRFPWQDNSKFAMKAQRGGCFLQNKTQNMKRPKLNMFEWLIKFYLDVFFDFIFVSFFLCLFLVSLHYCSAILREILGVRGGGFGGGGCCDVKKEILLDPIIAIFHN